MTRVRRSITMMAVAAASVGSFAATAGAQAGSPQASPSLRALVAQQLGDQTRLSAGSRMWLNPPRSAGPATARPSSVTFGSNVDANDPNRDLGAGQSETAIAAQRAPDSSRLVIAGWNDVSGFFSPTSTTPQGSLTGIAASINGGHSFTDLVGLPNNNADQQWSGDPTMASLGDGSHFAVASLYYPSLTACSDGLPAYGTVAVTIATVRKTARGLSTSFTSPISVANPGNLCTLFTGHRIPPNLATLDKDWISYDPTSRTLAISYTRFYFGGGGCDPSGCTDGHSGDGQIEVVRAHVPTSATSLAAADFQRPAVIWPEEPFCSSNTPSSEQSRCGAVDQGAYNAVAPGGDVYVAWERNIDTNTFDGDPYIYEHAALLPHATRTPSVGGTDAPVVLTQGMRNSTPDGGVRSLDVVPIPGYSRGTGNDFPRVAVDSHHHRVVFVWNDGSLHPLGNIWLRSAPFGLAGLSKVARVDDGDTYALHFLPAVSVRNDGTICTSWYDRTAAGATSTVTDYVADCRATPGTNAEDVLVTTGSTDWSGTGSLIDPNFGDYTDSASDGTRTYYTWSDGRIGVPQPFVATS